MFQFVSQTWLGMVKQYGAKHGLGSYADAISKDANGRYQADNPADRQAILALRNDPKVSALMAGEYANETKNQPREPLGRDVCGGELYAAHFLGPGAACRLIEMNESNPTASAAAAFPPPRPPTAACSTTATARPRRCARSTTGRCKQPKLSQKTLAQVEATRGHARQSEQPCRHFP